MSAEDWWKNNPRYYRRGIRIYIRQHLGETPLRVSFEYTDPIIFSQRWFVEKKHEGQWKKFAGETGKTYATAGEAVSAMAFIAGPQQQSAKG